MTKPYSLLTMILCALVTSIFHGPMVRAQQPAAGDHVKWVAEVLKGMQIIKPGMTRKELLAVFTTEGGISTRLQRSFVSRDCPYFKIDVAFKAAPGADRDREGRVREDSRDIIVTISRPYLAFMTVD